MELKIQILSIAVSAGLFGVVFELVRRRRMMERYALLWLFASVVLLALALWRDLLETLASAIGIFYAPSALFAIAFGFILVLLLHYSLVISRLADQNKVLSQRLGILQEQLESSLARHGIEAASVLGEEQVAPALEEGGAGSNRRAHAEPAQRGGELPGERGSQRQTAVRATTTVRGRFADGEHR